MYKLRQDELPWLEHAQQILDGKFDEADDSTRKSLLIGLRGICHPLCKAAVLKIQSLERQSCSGIDLRQHELFVI